MKQFAWCVLTSFALGLVAGVLICGIALDHNPQGEFRDTVTGVIDWPYLLILGACWAVATAVVAFVPVALVSLFLRRQPASRKPA